MITAYFKVSKVRKVRMAHHPVRLLQPCTLIDFGQHFHPVLLLGWRECAFKGKAGSILASPGGENWRNSLILICGHHFSFYSVLITVLNIMKSLEYLKLIFTNIFPIFFA